MFGVIYVQFPLYATYEFDNSKLKYAILYFGPGVGVGVGVNVGFVTTFNFNVPPPTVLKY